MSSTKKQKKHAVWIRVPPPSSSIQWGLQDSHDGGPSNDLGYGVAWDDLGNVYATGGFKGTIDFDPGPGTAERTSSGNYDVFLLKLAPNGYW